MKNIFKSIVSLTLICAVIALLLAVSNEITAPIIELNEQMAVQQAMKEVLPSGENFSPIDISGAELPVSIQEAYSEDNGGYVFKMSVTGYASGMIVLCGIDASGSVSGATCITSNETLSVEKTFGQTFAGIDRQTVDQVATTAGATRTTQAYKNAITDALTAFDLLKGAT